MQSEWECMTIDDLFALREQMQEVLSAKLKAKKGRPSNVDCRHSISSQN